MSSPNEPGHPRAGDAPGSGNGSAGGSSPHDGGSLGSAASRTGSDTPPWQRGPAARRGPASRSASRRSRTPGRRPPRSDGPAGHSPGVDARLNRFIAGGPGSSAPAPTHEQERPGARRAHRDRPARGLRQRASRPVGPDAAHAAAAQARARTPAQSRRAGHGRPAASRSAPGTKARCGPACRSAGSTRGAR